MSDDTVLLWQHVVIADERLRTRRGDLTSINPEAIYRVERFFTADEVDLVFITFRDGTPPGIYEGVPSVIGIPVGSGPVD